MSDFLNEGGFIRAIEATGDTHPVLKFFFGWPGNYN